MTEANVMAALTQANSKIGVINQLGLPASKASIRNTANVVGSESGQMISYLTTAAIRQEGVLAKALEEKAPQTNVQLTDAVAEAPVEGAPRGNARIQQASFETPFRDRPKGPLEV